MMSGIKREAVGLQEHAGEQHRRERHAVEHHDGHGPDAHGGAGDHREAGEVRQGDAAGRTDEHPRKGRAAAEAAQRQPVGDALADDERDEGADAPAGRVLDEPGKGSPDRRRAPRTELRPVICTNTTTTTPTRKPTTGVSISRRGATTTADCVGQSPDGRAEHGGEQADDDRPPELGEIGCRERRDVGHGEREGAVAGP